MFADGTFSFSTASYSDGATLFSQIGVSGTLEAGETSATIDTIYFAEITLIGLGPVVLFTGGGFTNDGSNRNIGVANFGGPSAALAGPVNAAFNHDVNTTLDLHGFYELGSDCRRCDDDSFVWGSHVKCGSAAYDLEL